MSARRRIALIAALALGGIALAALITWGTSRLVSQRIGLASEPLTAGQRLLPAALAPAAPPSSSQAAPTTTPSSKTTTRSETTTPARTTAPAPARTTAPAPAGTTTPATTAPSSAPERPTTVREQPQAVPEGRAGERSGAEREGGDSSARRDD